MISLFKKPKPKYTSQEIVNEIVDPCEWKLASNKKYVIKVGRSSFKLVGTQQFIGLYLNDQVLIATYQGPNVSDFKGQAKMDIKKFITQFTDAVDK